jgi:hypothetical protein
LLSIAVLAEEQKIPNTWGKGAHVRAFLSGEKKRESRETLNKPATGFPMAQSGRTGSSITGFGSLVCTVPGRSDEDIAALVV